MESQNRIDPFSKSLPSDFVGRIQQTNKALSLIAGLIENRSPLKLIITGDRGIGKSSFISLIEEKSSNENLLFAHIAINSADSQRTLLQGIINKVTSTIDQVQALAATLRELLEHLKRLKGAGIEYRTEAKDQITIQQFIEQIHDFDLLLKKHNKKLIIVIDEADVASPEVNLGVVTKTLSDKISVNSPEGKANIHNIGFILCGLPAVMSILKKDHPSSARIETITLKPFSPRETDQLLEKIESDFRIQITAKAKSHIKRFSSGNPFFIKVFTKYSHEEAAFNQSDIVGYEHFLKGATKEDGALDTVSRSFFNFELSEAHRYIIGRLVDAKPETPVTTASLLETAGPFTKDEISRALDDLSRSIFITSADNRLSIESDGLKAWYFARLDTQSLPLEFAPFGLAVNQLLKNGLTTFPKSLAKVDIFAHTGYNYLQVFKRHNISVQRVRLILTHPDQIKSKIQSDSDYAKFCLIDSINGWHRLRFIDGRISELEIRSMDKTPNYHVLIIDSIRGHIGDLHGQDSQKLRILNSFLFGSDQEHYLKEQCQSFESEWQASGPFPIDWAENISAVTRNGSASIDDDGYVDSFLRHRKIPISAVNQWCTEISALLSHVDSSVVNLLDVGSGLGRFSVPFSKIQPGRLAITAIDRSHEMLEVGRNHAKDLGAAIDFVHGDFLGCDFTLKERRFELVFASDVLHLIEDRSGFFAAANRLLKVNGRLILRVQCHKDMENLDWLVKLDLLEKEKLRSMPIEVIIKLAESHGFELSARTSIDESVSYASKSEFFSMLRDRPYSILRTEREEIIRERIDQYERSIKDVEFLVESKMTMLVFSKTDEPFSPY